MRRRRVAGLLVAISAALVSGASGACGAFSVSDPGDGGTGVGSDGGADGVVVGTDGMVVGDAIAGEGAIVDGIPKSGKLAFVSQTVRHPPALNVDAADAFCASEASAAGRPGTYAAWMSTATVDAIAHVANGVNSHWYLRDGTSVADKTALSSGPLINPLNRDAAGQLVTGTTDVWTGSFVGGVAAQTTCANWTLATGTGEVGDYRSPTTAWTANGILSCGFGARVYCFEK